MRPPASRSLPRRPRAAPRLSPDRPGGTPTCGRRAISAEVAAPEAPRRHTVPRSSPTGLRGPAPGITAPEIREKALRDFYGAAHHQGEGYPASDRIGGATGHWAGQPKPCTGEPVRGDSIASMCAHADASSPAPVTREPRSPGDTGTLHRIRQPRRPKRAGPATGTQVQAYRRRCLRPRGLFADAENADGSGTDGADHREQDRTTGVVPAGRSPTRCRGRRQGTEAQSVELHAEVWVGFA